MTGRTEFMDGEWDWETGAGWDEALGLGNALLEWRYSRPWADGRSEQLMAVWEGNDVQVQMQQRQSSNDDDLTGTTMLLLLRG